MRNGAAASWRPPAPARAARPGSRAPSWPSPARWSVSSLRGARPGRPGTSAEAAQLVAARGHDLEVVTEQFNEARATLDTQRAAAEAAKATLEQAAAALGAAQQQVRGIARSAWTGEGLSSFQALMTSDSANDFVDRMSTLQLVAGHQNAVLGRPPARTSPPRRPRPLPGRRRCREGDLRQGRRTAGRPAEAGRGVQGGLRPAECRREAARRGATPGPRQPVADARPRAPSGPVVASSDAAQVAIDTAMAQRGKPYVWAASGPGSFDCSGLTAYAYRAAGISLPHSSALQSHMGKAVSRADLQPGDLVFFYSPVSHVGIYIGNGQMVHAPTSGDVVKVASVDSMGDFVGGRRIAA